MAHVQALTGGIGEFHQRVVFGAGIAGNSGVGLFIQPALLPLFLDAVKIIVSHGKNMMCRKA